MTSIESTGAGHDPFTPRIPRRQAMAALGAGATAFAGLHAFGQQDDQPLHAPLPDAGWDPQAKEYVLPKLPYDYNALEPHIDEQTMRLHHDKHHAGYVKGLNEAVDALKGIRTENEGGQHIQYWLNKLAFNGSGHFLHTIFWHCMTPGGSSPSGQISKMLDRDFGSSEGFLSLFVSAASSVEGSGWGLLVYDPLSDHLRVMQAEKHQNLTIWGVIPLVVIDVWEHAYYLKYQNKRGEYVKAFTNLINWEFAERKLQGTREAMNRTMRQR